MAYLQQARSQTLKAIPDGVGGVRETLAHMMNYVREYKKDQEVRGLAVQLTLSLEQKDYTGEVESIFEFVQNNIRYVQDIADVETLQTPAATLQIGAGDCDDKATLLAALLESIGHKTRFVAVGFSIGQFDHVYVETLIGVRWVPLDPTEPNGMGWAPPGAVTRIERHN